MQTSDTADDATRKPADVTFADDAAAALLAGRIDALRQPEEAGWERIKHNPSRTVYFGRIGGQDIYLKHFHSRALEHRLGRLLGGCAARREMRFSQYLRACGVPTPEPLAMACGAEEWLATRAVAPALPADVWQDRQGTLGADGARAVRAVTVALADLVGRMHAAGVIHRDLHCGNILVRTDRTGPEPVLMDLHRASRRRRLSRRARAANLAQLLHDRYDFTTRSDRLRFLRRYLQVSGAAGTLRGWNLLVENFARRHIRRFFHRRDRRIFGVNRYFAPVRLTGGWRGHVVLASKRRLAGSRAAEMEFDSDAWRQALADPLSLLDGPDVKVLKDSPSSRVVRRTLKVGEQTVDVVIKSPRRKKAWKVLVDCFRMSRSLRAFRLGHVLLARRVANALPLAALERRAGPFLLDHLLITETVDAPKLNDFLDTVLACQPRGPTELDNRQQRRLAQEFLAQMGRLLQRLHDNHFAHRDLKANNLLVQWSPGRRPELVLVDLDGLREVAILTARRKFQGLMRLNVSLLKCPAVNHAGRLRMLLGYLRRPGGGRIAFKPYWRMLETWSARKLHQQISSRRRAQRVVRQREEAGGRAPA